MSELKMTTLTSTTWISTLMLCVVFITFGIYVSTEKTIDLTNKERQAGFQMVSQLRQISDDLTQMVRLYVVTRDLRYKQYHQNILDIRNGNMIRPEGYTLSYWDLVIAGDLVPPLKNGKGIPLTDLIQKSGFTKEEISNLIIANNNLEALTKIGFEAIKFADSVGEDTKAKRTKTRQLLFEDSYYQAKSKIMQPINTFYSLMDQRTLSTVNDAMVMAKLFRLICIASALFAMWLLWRSYADLKKKLGGTAQEVHQLITSIRKGDYSNLAPLTPNNENSVLASLIKIQGTLLANEIERTHAAFELQKTLTRFQAMFESHAIGIVVIDKSYMIEAFNRTSEVMFGYNKAEVLGRNVNILMPEPYHSEHNSFIEHYVKTGQKSVVGLSWEVLGKHKNGTIFPIQIILGDASFGKEPCYIGFIEDITERKRQSADSKLYELLVKNSDDAIITKQLDGTITSWNLAAYALFGYSTEEMVGKSIYKLLPPDCYDEEEAIRAIVSQKKPVRQLETVRLHKDGRLLNVSITLSPIIDETGTVIGISKVVRDIHELKQSLIQIQTLAFYDSLTGLPNRRLLLERLKTALPLSERDQQFGAILFLDMDRFKTLNDSQGHEAGDKLLIDIATRLKSCVRETETVARLGGDEFVVLIESLGTDTLEASNIAALVAEKIRVTLSAPYTINNFVFYSSPSIGVYLFLGKKDTDDEVIKRADIAMYQAKNSGRNCVRFYDAVLQKQMAAYDAMRLDIYQALDEHQFQLYYQIQIDHNSQPIGAEALIRWQHPKRGLVNPTEFIHIAEDNTNIMKIGYWVLDSACQQIAAWSHHALTQDLVLAVNVSGKEFNQPDFIEILTSIIKKHRIEPSRLKLELTESVALDNFEQAILKIIDLNIIIGIKLALNDFGTGFSSLSYLKNLPIHQVKIDQSFIRDMDTSINSTDTKMVKTIIDMAHNFDLDVIADGLETDVQLALLKKLGCTSFQGYLFSKPLPIDAFEALLKTFDIRY